MKNTNTLSFSLINRFTFLPIFLIGSVLISSCSKKTEKIETPVVTAPLTGTPQISMTTLLSNQGIIWGFDFLPNGNLLYTQKTGAMFLFDTTTRAITNITGLPTNISSSGQGGLLDVAVSPDFATTKTVYVTYSITGGFLSLARFVLNETNTSNWMVLHTTESASTWSGHYGSRIVFGKDGKLYWSIGEGGTARTRIKMEFESIVQGHLHTQCYIDWVINDKARVFGMQVGCGIDYTSYAMGYAKLGRKPAIACGVVINGRVPINIIMD
jgi:glucose/arabinose dehydrogenase